MHHENLILRNVPDPNDEDWYDDMTHSIEALEDHAFYFNLEDEEIVEGAGEIVWSWEEDDEWLGGLTLFVDSHYEVCVLSIRSVKAGDLRRIVATLERVLDVVSLEELKTAAQPKLLMEPPALLKLAYASSSRSRPDKDTLDLIEKGLSHRNPKVRYYAACAAKVTGWPVLIDEIEQLLQGEKVAEVKKMAAWALSECQRRA